MVAFPETLHHKLYRRAGRRWTGIQIPFTLIKQYTIIQEIR